MRRRINGILLLDKPHGITSNGALQRIKRLYQAEKVGHTGSLDPIATGMLPLCFGEATKFSQYLLDSDKTYYVTAKLGEQTNTADSEGEVIARYPIADITAARIAEVMTTFLGKSEQIPPMFSAIKHQGKPLYELARRGIEIERKPREITLFSLTLTDFSGDHFSFRVHCSKGTYVRTLVEDIARSLNCGAHVVELRRESVSPYKHQMIYTLTTLETIAETSGGDALMQCLLPIETALAVLPAVTLSTATAFYLRMGQPVRVAQQMQSPLVRLLSEDAKFLGVGEVMDDGRVKPHRLIAQV